MGQAKRFSKDIADGVKRSADILKQPTLEGLRTELDSIVPRVKQVIQQTKMRVFGNTRATDKLFSVFEPSTEIIRKGKAGKPSEFGKVVKLQEAENPATGRNRQIIIVYEVYDQRPSDSDLLIPSIEAHEEKLHRTPRLVATDAGFYSSKNETAAQQKGVKRVCVPNRSTKSAERRREPACRPQPAYASVTRSPRSQ